MADREPVVIDPLGLELLDAAALGCQDTRTFSEPPNCPEPGGLVERVGAQRIVETFDTLRRRGMIVARRLDEPGTPDTVPSSESLLATLIRPSMSPVIEYRLTQLGAQVWGEYRRPNWSQFSHWKWSESGLACVAGSKEWARQLAGWVVALSGDSAARVGALTDVEDWRETYWRDRRTGFRIEVLQSSRQAHASLSHASRIVRGAGFVGVPRMYTVYSEDEEWPWVLW